MASLCLQTIIYRLGQLVEKELVNGKMELFGKLNSVVMNKLLKRKRYYNNHEMWQLSNPRWYWGGVIMPINGWNEKSVAKEDSGVKNNM